MSSLGCGDGVFVVGMWLLSVEVLLEVLLLLLFVFVIDCCCICDGDRVI